MPKTEVILTHNVIGLGGESDQVKVAAGYARNYLFPQGLAIPLTAANKRRRRRRLRRKEKPRNAPRQPERKPARPVRFASPAPRRKRRRIKVFSPEFLCERARRSDLPVFLCRRFLSTRDGEEVVGSRWTSSLN